MSIMFRWLSADTITDPYGGDNIDYIYDSLTVDGTVSEQYTQASLVTEHPIEEGTPITDNVRPELRRVQLEILVSPCSNGWADNPFENNIPPEDRPAFTRSKINQLIREAIEVELETNIGYWESMLLISAEERRDVNVGDSYRAVIQLQEIKKVTTLEVEAPAPRVERARQSANNGAQGSGTEKEEGDVIRSAAESLRNLLDPTARGGQA